MSETCFSLNEAKGSLNFILVLKINVNFSILLYGADCQDVIYNANLWIEH